MKWPLVEIEWVDSGSHEGWVNISELITKPGLGCISVGWLLGESEMSITIASHVAFDDFGAPDQVSGDMTIPKIAITKRRVLVKDKK